MLPLLPLFMAAMLAACAPLHAGDATVPELLLLGEQHDHPEHPRLHHRAVRDLARDGKLVALALEMAERGTTTAALSRDADEAAVRAALRWNDEAWPWAAYAPAIMAAVRAGVPVLGANLPRPQMPQAMKDEALDRTLPEDALARQRSAIRAGHCDLLPETQIAPMTRVQIARDRTMAHLLAETARPGGTVVLLAGSGHVDPEVGVPRHLPPRLRAQPRIWPTSGGPARDYCAELRQQWQRRP